MKSGVAMMVGALIRAQARGGAAGDLVLAVLADEEAGGLCGAPRPGGAPPPLFPRLPPAIGETRGAPLPLPPPRVPPLPVSGEPCWHRLPTPPCPRPPRTR